MMEISIPMYSDIENLAWSINNFYIQVLYEVLSLLLFIMKTNIYQTLTLYQTLCWVLSMYYLFNPHKNPVR